MHKREVETTLDKPCPSHASPEAASTFDKLPRTPNGCQSLEDCTCSLTGLSVPRSSTRQLAFSCSSGLRCDSFLHGNVGFLGREGATERSELVLSVLDHAGSRVWGLRLWDLVLNGTGQKSEMKRDTVA